MFCCWLKKTRRSLGLTQTALGEAVGAVSFSGALLTVTCTLAEVSPYLATSAAVEGEKRASKLPLAAVFTSAAVQIQEPETVWPLLFTG